MRPKKSGMRRRHTTTRTSRARSRSPQRPGPSSRRGMSTASKVALASAAGVLAATAAGLATTRTGRRLTRDARTKLTPYVRSRLSDMIDTVEASLAEAGLLTIIPAKVRMRLMQKLVGHTSSGNGKRTTNRTRQRARRTRPARSSATSAEQM